jgi:hypothetical protein
MWLRIPTEKTTFSPRGQISVFFKQWFGGAAVAHLWSLVRILQWEDAFPRLQTPVPMLEVST